MTINCSNLHTTPPALTHSMLSCVFLGIILLGVVLSDVHSCWGGRGYRCSLTINLGRNRPPEGVQTNNLQRCEWRGRWKRSKIDDQKTKNSSRLSKHHYLPESQPMIQPTSTTSDSLKTQSCHVSVQLGRQNWKAQFTFSQQFRLWRTQQCYKSEDVVHMNIQYDTLVSLLCASQITAHNSIGNYMCYVYKRVAH